MRTTRFLLLILVFVTACRSRREGASNTSKPSNQNFVRFGLAPAPGTPVRLASSDIEAQRDGNDLIVRLSDISVDFDPRDEIRLQDLSVSAYKRDGTGKVGDSNKQDVSTLNPATPNTVLPVILQLKVKGAGDACDSGCVVALNLSFQIISARSEALAELAKSAVARISSVQTDRETIDLSSGRSSRFGESVTKATAASTGSCDWLSEAEAAAIIGQHGALREEREGGFCGVSSRGAPAGASNVTLNFKVDADISAYNAFVQRDDATVIPGLGDRAVWNGDTHTVAVVKGKRKLVLSIADAKHPSTIKEPDLQEKALAAAAKIVGKM
jgi:hypothetical protein